MKGGSKLSEFSCGRCQVISIGLHLSLSNHWKDCFPFSYLQTQVETKVVIPRLARGCGEADLEVKIWGMEAE